MSRSRSSSLEVVPQPKKKMTKLESLRPISAHIETLLVSHGCIKDKAKRVVGDIADRLVTAGFSWDKILMCHTKGEGKFCKHLIPHVFMSKDHFPPSITPDDVLHKVYNFIDEWKCKLHAMLSGTEYQSQPSIPVKEELINRKDDNHIESKSRIEKNKESTTMKKSSESENQYHRKYSPEGKRPKVGKGCSPEERRSSREWSLEQQRRKRERSLEQHRRKRERSQSTDDDRHDRKRTRSEERRPQRRPSRGMARSYRQNRQPTLRKWSRDRKRRSSVKSCSDSSSERNTETEEEGSKDCISSSSSSDEDDNRNRTTLKEAADIHRKSLAGKTLLEKVNAIITTCNKMKEDTNISEAKLNQANTLIKKAEDKRNLITEKSMKKEDTVNDSEEDRKTPTAYRFRESDSELQEAVDGDAKVKDECELKNVVNPALNQNTEHSLEDGEVKNDSNEEKEESDQDKCEQWETKRIKKALEDELKKLKSEVKTRSSVESSVRDELQAMSGKGNKLAEAASRRERSKSRSRSRFRSRSRSKSWSRSRSRSRSKSWSRSRSRSPPRSYQRSRESEEHRPYNQNHRGRGEQNHFRDGGRGGERDYYRHHKSDNMERSLPVERQGQHWIPVTPCTIEEDTDLAPGETVGVYIRAKGEFSFKDNSGSMVRITKWTGKDSMSRAFIKPQIVELGSSTVRIEVSNHQKDGVIKLLKHDKIACLSVLSAPIEPGLFRNMDYSPDRYYRQDKRWFKFTTVVLHKKGSKLVLTPPCFTNLVFYFPPINNTLYMKPNITMNELAILPK